MKSFVLVGQACAWIGRACLLLLCIATAALAGCAREEQRLLPRSLTWAELRTVRAGVRITPPDEAPRAPYMKERLSDGTKVAIGPGGLAWLRRDGGATLLVRGPSELTLRARSLVIGEGRVFADTPPGTTTDVDTPAGKLALSDVRASLDVSKEGTVRAYVLSGEVRTAGGRARAGEELTLAPGSPPKVRAVRAWEDWTGGLATTVRNAAPAPFGVGTVGARRPGDQGSPRFPLSIQRMDVRVTFDGDFAVTEVDQTFFNPASETVEGLYGFRTPARAILQRYGVDRGGIVVWGRVKEKAAAAAEYRANVYEGSTEDPSLLEWDAPGVYRARLYPIGPGATRRVVVRYAEWLDRTGERAERRLYVYPMAAEGSEASLPHVEELKVTFALGRSGAREVRVGMDGVRRGDELVVRAHDFVPRADLALELFDDGGAAQRGYTAPHFVDLAALPPGDRSAAAARAKAEAPYVLVPVRPEAAKLPAGGLDLAIVIDASAATDKATLAIARAATSALLAHLGGRDRVLVLAGDAELRPVVPELSKLATLDAATREKIQDALARVARGGSTDLGAMIAEAARQLEPGRRSAVVYIGDASPTVGELALGALRARLDKLPHRARVFGLGVGDSARLDLLAGICHGAFAERITDGAQAARAALKVLEEAERPVWLGTKVELGTGADRVFPREASALVGGDTLWVMGRVASEVAPRSIRITSAAGAREVPLELSRIEDSGDLGRRWAEARLAQMLEEGEGRAALVDLGMRQGIITPVTSFYVPSASQMTADERTEFEAQREKQTQRSSRFASAKDAAPQALPSVASEAASVPVEPEVSNNKEGGTGSRARDEERAEKVSSPLANAKKPTAPMRRGDVPTGALDGLESGVAAPLATAEPRPPRDADSAPKGEGTGDLSLGSGGGLRPGAAGGGLGLSGIGLVGRGDAAGAGSGRLGGSHAAQAVKVRTGALSVTGRLPQEVVSRIVRQQFGRFRACYEAGLAADPRLEGTVRVRFIIQRDGGVSNVSDQGSSLRQASVIECVRLALGALTFPSPEDGPATVILPISFTSDGSEPAARPAVSNTSVVVNVFVGDLPRKRLGCSAAAASPLEARIPLWRERLASVAGNAEAVVRVYRSALAECEADSFRERSRLLYLMLDAMPGVAGKVTLYQAMRRDLGAADVLYRGMLARIRTPEEMRELHASLGLESVDPAILDKLVRETPDAHERLARLRALAREFPDDFNLALAVLDALEDVGNAALLADGARALRERPDADASIRTSVGELYLRLAAREKAAEPKARWVGEARRAFGEIVEFAPQDPVARRRLGDLLLSHGFFAEAERQYETLATLTPDEPKVFLLLAAAAQGRGLLEQALKFAEKAGASGAPGADSGASATARAVSATYLAWGRAAARDAKRADELRALTARAARVLGSDHGAGQPHGARVSLTWSHPELHPTLWTNALGSAMPAPDGDVTLGILQAIVPERDTSFVEVRLEPADLARAARLGAVARLTVVFDELGEAEKIIELEVRFERAGPASQRFSLAGKEVRRG